MTDRLSSFLGSFTFPWLILTFVLDASSIVAALAFKNFTIKNTEMAIIAADPTATQTPIITF